MDNISDNFRSVVSNTINDSDKTSENNLRSLSYVNDIEKNSKKIQTSFNNYCLEDDQVTSLDNSNSISYCDTGTQVDDGIIPTMTESTSKNLKGKDKRDRSKGSLRALPYLITVSEKNKNKLQK